MESYEGTVSGAETISFSIKPRKITIINDSAIKTLKFRFGESESWATLNPTETVSMHIIVRNIYLSGTADYRIWGIG